MQVSTSTVVLDVSSLKDGRYKLSYFQANNWSDCRAVEFPFFTMSGGTLTLQFQSVWPGKFDQHDVFLISDFPGDRKYAECMFDNKDSVVLRIQLRVSSRGLLDREKKSKVQSLTSPALRHLVRMRWRCGCSGVDLVKILFWFILNLTAIAEYCQRSHVRQSKTRFRTLRI